MTDIEQLQEQYKKDCFDPTQPFLTEVYHLTKNFGNDYELGGKVRELIQKFEAFNKERLKIETDQQLKNILEENGQA